MWVENRQFVFTGSTNIIETIKNTDELLNMKGILLENKQTGVIISSSQLFDYALLPCPSFSPAWNGAGRYDQVNTHQADDLPLQTDDQPPKTDDQALQPDDHALQPEDQTLQPDHQEYQENHPYLFLFLFTTKVFHNVNSRIFDSTTIYQYLTERGGNWFSTPSLKSATPTSGLNSPDLVYNGV